MFFGRFWNDVYQFSIFSLNDSFHNDFTIKLCDDKFVKILLILPPRISFKRFVATVPHVGADV